MWKPSRSTLCTMEEKELEVSSWFFISGLSKVGSITVAEGLVCDNNCSYYEELRMNAVKKSFASILNGRWNREPEKAFEQVLEFVHH